MLQDLKPAERALLLLCDLQQLPDHEAAAVFSLAPEQLRDRLARARARFRHAYLAHDTLITDDHDAHAHD